MIILKIFISLFSSLTSSTQHFIFLFHHRIYQKVSFLYFVILNKHQEQVGIQIVMYICTVEFVVKREKVMIGGKVKFHLEVSIITLEPLILSGMQQLFMVSEQTTILSPTHKSILIKGTLLLYKSMGTSNFIRRGTYKKS